MALSDKEVVELIRRVMDAVDDTRLHFELRRIRFRATRRTREYVKACMALVRLNLPITTSLVAAAVFSTESTVIQTLHTLGDKDLLVFWPTKRAHYMWKPSEKLIELMKICLPSIRLESLMQPDD